MKILKGIGWILAGVMLIGAIIFFVLPPKGNIPVLMYHAVGCEEDLNPSNNCITPEAFEKQMLFLKFFGYRVISMDDFYEIRSGQKQAPGRAVVITFDDGDPSFETRALPLLTRLGFPVAMFFVSAQVRDRIDAHLELDSLRSLMKNPLVTVGAHTMTHPHLVDLTPEQIKEEMVGSRSELERIFGRRVDYFAYPYGEVDEKTSRMAKESGYRLAFTTSPKKLGALPLTPYTMTRLKISPAADHPVVFWGLLSGVYESFKVWKSSLKHHPAGQS